ncbi:hypothetical protein D9619_011411 [Psilocybe cf. subviscida]|uniref:Uncharacterized protein n=1 Tax=Psilocybe cf. subviscida TaxID=2480587 RepID=A0A8H5F5L1_9AGAR|nr:hypothetical protein D9619_011411 [Psilocybe cf. subviscida]
MYSVYLSTESLFIRSSEGGKLRSKCHAHGSTDLADERDLAPVSSLDTNARFLAYAATNNPRTPARLKYAPRLIILKRFQVTASPSDPPLTMTSAMASLQPTLKQQHLCDPSSALRHPGTVFTLSGGDPYDISTPRISAFLHPEGSSCPAQTKRTSSTSTSITSTAYPGSWALDPPSVARLGSVSASLLLHGRTQLVQYLKRHVATLTPASAATFDVFAQNSFDPPGCLIHRSIRGRYSPSWQLSLARSKATRSQRLRPHEELGPHIPKNSKYLLVTFQLFVSLHVGPQIFSVTGSNAVFGLE